MTIASVNFDDAARVQYRLGDAVLMRSAAYGRRAMEMVASNDSFEGSLLHTYAARIDRGSADPQWSILQQLVQERVASADLPQPARNELVVHLRLGNGKGFDQSGEKPERLVRYVVDTATAERTDQVVVVTAIHFGASHLRKHCDGNQIAIETRQAQQVADQIMGQLSDAGLDVRLHSDEDIDEAFCFLAGAHRLVLGNGHFSLCAAMISNAKVFVPSWARPGSSVDIDSLLRSRAPAPDQEP
jgi:hypothetical protein